MIIIKKEQKIFKKDPNEIYMYGNTTSKIKIPLGLTAENPLQN